MTTVYATMFERWEQRVYAACTQTSVSGPDHFGKSGSASKSKFKSWGGSKLSLGGPWTLTVESWRLKLEPWRVCKPMVADSHHFEMQYSDPDSHQSDKSDPDSHQNKKTGSGWKVKRRIRMQVMRILSTDSNWVFVLLAPGYRNVAEQMFLSL